MKTKIIVHDQHVKTFTEAKRNEDFKLMIIDTISKLSADSFGEISQVDIRNDLLANIYIGNIKSLGGNKNVPEAVAIFTVNNDDYLITSFITVQKMNKKQEKKHTFLDTLKNIFYKD